MTYASKRITVACLLVIAFIAVQAIPAHSLDPASPELVGQLTQGLSVTPQQATGGAGFCSASPRASSALPISAKSPQSCRAWIVF